MVVYADTTADELVFAFLNEINFDYDHPYCYKYRSTSGKNITIADDRVDDAGILANQITIGEIEIVQGDSVYLIYDFGDNWQFEIKFLDTDYEKGRDLGNLSIIARKGEPPEQYDY